MRSRTAYRFELMVVAYFLFTGDYSDLLTFKIPGLSFFAIQPERFVFFTCLFLWIRKFLSGSFRRTPGESPQLPLFLIVLVLFSLSGILSQATHFSKIGISEVLVQTVYFSNFVLVLLTMRFVVDTPFIEVIGRTVIITSVLAAIICLIQLGVDHSFMRVGDFRQAFGSVLRSNGIFSSEYTNSYFLIIAIYWTLYLLKNYRFKWLLVGLFIAGIFTSFHRMSWLILTLTLVFYFLWMERSSIEQALLVGLSGIAVLLIIFAFSYREIANSSIVKDRLNDSIEGREGYWSMVANNIGDKPFFGFGDKNNDVYYRNMLRITRDRDRATGYTGDIHNGYLQSMFILGIPSFLLFAGFIISSIVYFWKLLRYHPFFTIPFLFCVLYGIANFTNNFSFDKPLAFIFAIQLGIGLGARHLEEYYPFDAR